MTATEHRTDPAPTHALAADELPVWPQHDESERTALLRALDQGQWWRVGGTEVSNFEAEFAAYNGAPYALAVNSGTTALELALRVHGIGPGDEVVVPAFTFVSTALAVQNVGATPVPADVDPGHQCLTPEAVKAAAGPRTRAVMPVHMAGHVADLDGLRAAADAHGAVLIQDAAHAQGSARDGRLIGTDPSIACYSFQNGKLMTAGEGGALTFADEESYERAYLMHTVGRPRGDVRYRHVTPGMNARINEFTAAVLRTQLARLADQTRTRQARADLLDGLLVDIPGLTTQRREAEVTTNAHYMYLLALDEERFTTEDRDRLVASLLRRNLPVCINFPPVYRTDSFWQGPTEPLRAEELAERCPESERIGRMGLWMHHRTLLAEPRTVHRIAEVIATAVAELDHR